MGQDQTAQRTLTQTQGIYIPIGGKFYHCGALCQRCFPHKSANSGWAMVNVRVLESSPDLGPDFIGIRHQQGEKIKLDMGWNYCVPDDQVEFLLTDPQYDPS